MDLKMGRVYSSRMSKRLLNFFLVAVLVLFTGLADAMAAQTDVAADHNTAHHPTAHVAHGQTASCDQPGDCVAGHMASCHVHCTALFVFVSVSPDIARTASTVAPRFALSDHIPSGLSPGPAIIRHDTCSPECRTAALAA